MGGLLPFESLCIHLNIMKYVMNVDGCTSSMIHSHVHD